MDKLFINGVLSERSTDIFFLEKLTKLKKGLKKKYCFDIGTK